MNLTQIKASGRPSPSIRRLTEAKIKMKKYPLLRQILRTIFNAEDGLDQEASIRLYRRSFGNGEKLEQLELELRDAFAQTGFSWREMLCNDEFEVCYLDSENDARELARKLLWSPIFDKQD